MVSLSDEQRNFLTRVRAFIPLAEAAGVPAAVMVAQAAIESGWGRSGLARDGNAYFGVKARSGWHGTVYCGTTKEWTGRDYVTIPGTGRIDADYDEALAAGCARAALSRAYDAPEANIRDYLAFCRANSRYRRALDVYAVTRDPRRFAVEIAAAGCATSPTYAITLLTFMERHLAALLPPKDRGALGRRHDLGRGCAAGGRARLCPAQVPGRGVGHGRPVRSDEPDGVYRGGTPMKISGALIEAIVGLLRGIGLPHDPEEGQVRRQLSDLEKSKADIWVVVRATTPSAERVYV